MSDILLDLLLAEADRQDFLVMIGVLRTGRGEALAAVQSYLERFTGGDPGVEALRARRICGFTVTPPEGAGLSQDLILQELQPIAETGVPLAIYQLPQITGNEMSPETVASLASRYPNLYLFKDTSGHDRVALSALDLDGLFLVRGAESGYSRWFKASAGNRGHSTPSSQEASTGKYDGFLLSTANCFARELSEIICCAAEGRLDEADALSGRVSAVMEGVFAEASLLDFGNPFSNANKAMDHCRAWGGSYGTAPLPMTCSGNPLPRSLIDAAAGLMDRYGFKTIQGYLE
jgi:dihydrodipicolinate synthase/N-acetylneuraminate lyase